MLDTTNWHLQSVIHPQTMGAHKDSSDRMADYLIDDAKEGDDFDSWTLDQLKDMDEFRPHIFVYALDNRVSRGEATRLSIEAFEKLRVLKWFPSHPFLVHHTDDPDYVLVVPPTPSSDYDSEQYTAEQRATEVIDPNVRSPYARYWLELPKWKQFMADERKSHAPGYLLDSYMTSRVFVRCENGDGKPYVVEAVQRIGELYHANGPFQGYRVEDRTKVTHVQMDMPLRATEGL